MPRLFTTVKDLENFNSNLLTHKRLYTQTSDNMKLMLSMFCLTHVINKIQHNGNSYV